MNDASEQLPPEEEETLGIPTFELVVRDGRPIVGGSYFLNPPLRAVEAEWDPDDATRLLVLADDGTRWHAVDVPREGRHSVELDPDEGHHPTLSRARAVVTSALAGEFD